MLGGLVLLTITCVMALFVTLVVAMAQNVNSKIRAAFVAFCAPLVLWQVTIFAADSVKSHLFLWNNLVFLWPTIAVLGCFFFVTLLVPADSQSARRRTWNVILLRIVYFLTAVQLVSILSNRIFSSITYDSVHGSYVFGRGSFYLVYVLAFVLVLLTAIAVLIYSYATSKKKSNERRAYRSVLVTILATGFYGIVTNIVIPVASGSQKLIGLGLFTVDFFAFGLAFSIARYRFLDIRAYVFRAVSYLAAVAFVTIAYVAVAGLFLAKVLGGALSGGAIVLLFIATLILAISFHPLQGFFNKLTNRLFYRDFYDPQDLIDRVSGLIVSTVNIDEIKSQSARIIEASLKAESVRYFLVADQSSSASAAAALHAMLESDLNVLIADETNGHRNEVAYKILKTTNSALAIRLRTTHEDLGFIVLGFRRSGTGYTVADIRALSTVADELAIGLQNSLRFREIENFNLTLQQKVEEATRSLRHANEKLRKLDKTKDDFISMASHQLRTPLTSVKGYVSMVLDDDAGEINKQQRMLLNQAFISAERMVYLISDLLNVSRLRTGKFIVEPIHTNLAKVVEEEVKQLIETAKGRKLELSYNMPEHFPVLMLDETKMRQVMMNFIDNAVYYTPSGGHIEVRLVDKPTTIEFTVHDDGIGVPRHEQHHLFTKFFRANNAKRARPDGTGLGLFMAKKVIVAQGGAIIFQSHEGKGSTFGFTFTKKPLLPTDDALQDKKAQ